MRARRALPPAAVPLAPSCANCSRWNELAWSIRAGGAACRCAARSPAAGAALGQSIRAPAGRPLLVSHPPCTAAPAAQKQAQHLDNIRREIRILTRLRGTLRYARHWARGARRGQPPAPALAYDLIQAWRSAWSPTPALPLAC